MPVYTYQCEECGVRFDVRQRFTEGPVTECPECGGAVHRVPQPVGIVFKGSGWYATDHKGSSALAAPVKRDAAAESKTPKSESKGDARTGTAPASSAPASD